MQFDAVCVNICNTLESFDALAVNFSTDQWKIAQDHTMVSSVVIGRYVFLALGFSTACTVLYTCITDGSPFRSELLTPWMSATLIDFYINVIAIAAWVWYKESCLAYRLIWIGLLVCFGSITTCWYIAVEFFKMSPDDPVYYVLLKDRTIRKGGRVAAAH